MERKKTRLGVAEKLKVIGSRALQLVSHTNLILVSLFGWFEPINSIAYGYSGVNEIGSKRFKTRERLNVVNSDAKKSIYMAYGVKGGGTIEHDRIFLDATNWGSARRKTTR